MAQNYWKKQNFFISNLFLPIILIYFEHHQQSSNLESFWLNNQWIFSRLRLHLLHDFSLYKEFIKQVVKIEIRLELWVRSFLFILPFFVKFGRIFTFLTFRMLSLKLRLQSVQGRVTFRKIMILMLNRQ